MKYTITHTLHDKLNKKITKNKIGEYSTIEKAENSCPYVVWESCWKWISFNMETSVATILVATSTIETDTIRRIYSIHMRV